MKQILETNNSRTCLLLYPEQIRYCCFIWNLEVTFIRRLFSQAISTFMVHSAILPVSAYEKHKCKSRNLSQLYQNYSKNENRITGQLIQRNATARNVYVPWPNINWARNKTCHSKKKNVDTVNDTQRNALFQWATESWLSISTADKFTVCDGIWPLWQ